MKRKIYILGTLALLCLLGTGYYAWTLYDAHQKQVTEWNEGAKAAFEEALWMEVNKRAEVPIYSSSSGEDGMITLKAKIPDSVSVMTMNGWQKYKIDRKKYDNSLIKETRKRARSSTLLKKYPLSIDSLSINWNRLLALNGITAKCKIRYIITDLDLRNDTVYSVTDNSLHFDSLTVSYLGFRCEHELVGYVSYPFWILTISLGNKCWFILPWIVFLLLLIFYASIERFLLSKLIKEKKLEKEIHVADVTIDKAKIYQLPDGILFDSFAGTLTKEDFVHTIPPHSALLLKLFLRKGNHRLTTDEIEQELWNGSGTIDRIHKAIQRLRVELRKVSPELTIKNINGDYELK